MIKYQIYEVIETSKHDKLANQSYTTVSRYTLENLGNYNIQPIHDSMESAVAEINKYASELLNKRLTILPIVDVNWQGRTDGVLEFD